MAIRFYTGSGYFHSNDWVDIHGKFAGVPMSNDTVVLDDKCTTITFGYKSKLHQFIYNIKNTIKLKSFKYWNKLTFKNLIFKGHCVVTIDKNVTVNNQLNINEIR